MKIYSERPSHPLPAMAATIGFFDGVHPGHQFLLQQVKELARERNMSTGVITFPIHPRKVLQADYHPQLLSTPEEKLDILSKFELDYCLLLPFTFELSQLSAREFMQFLHDSFHIRLLVIGYDHRFGHKRSESFEDYCRYGAEIGIQIERATAYTQEGDQVSSSAIRRLLLAGKVDEAAVLLGHSYTVGGKVVSGFQMGRKMGFPTANIGITCADKLIPMDGVYAVYVDCNQKRYAGMLNIGFRPTLNNGKNRSIEVHLIGFDGDLYEQSIQVTFVQFIRPEIKFDGIEELIEQMKKDRETALRYLPL